MTSPAIAIVSEKIKLFAEIIFTLKGNNHFQKNFLKEKDSKHMLKSMISEASENNTLLYHLDTDYMSKNVMEDLINANTKINTARKFHTYCSKNYVHEHMVPNERLYKIITRKDNLTVDWIIEILFKFGKRATITKEENILLNENFRQNMPHGFYEEKSELYHNHLARYKAVGIDRFLVKRRNNTWFEEYQNGFQDITFKGKNK